MKLIAISDGINLRFVLDDGAPFKKFGTEQILGTIDLPIEKEKKWVTKETTDAEMLEGAGPYFVHVDDPIPMSARKIKVTYEIEE